MGVELPRTLALCLPLRLLISVFCLRTPPGFPSTLAWGCTLQKRGQYSPRMGFLDFVAWALVGGWRGLSTAGWGRERSKLRQGNEVTRPPRVLSAPNCLATADSTGTHSLYTTYQDHEIMFHVSTMLPYTPNNQQQV